MLLSSKWVFTQHAGTKGVQWQSYLRIFLLNICAAVSLQTATDAQVSVFY
jgi:hypothetical protein